MKPTRVGLIGCGKVGTIHAAALNAHPEAELVACCDAVPDRAGAFAAKYGGKPFPDLTAMLKDGGVEAVVIGTPHPLHAEPAIRAAEAGYTFSLRSRWPLLSPIATRCSLPRRRPASRSASSVSAASTNRSCG